MRTVILTAVIFTMTLSLTAQTIDKPVHVDGKKVPLQEWYTTDGGETMSYKGSNEHIAEYAAILIYETDGMNDEYETRDADKVFEMEIDGWIHTVMVWYLSDGTVMHYLNTEGETGVIMLSKAEKGDPNYR